MLKRLWMRIRFGKIIGVITATAADGVIAEIKYYNRRCKTIGYWAYGAYDPAGPYTGGSDEAFMPHAEFIAYKRKKLKCSKHHSRLEFKKQQRRKGWNK
jgi:hypothetical protein